MKRIICIILVGMACGLASGKAEQTNKAPAKVVVRTSGHEHYGTLDKELEMTAAQKEKWNDVLKMVARTTKAVEENAKLTQEKKLDDIKRLHAVVDTKLRAILTPEQIKKWDKIRFASTNAVPAHVKTVAPKLEKESAPINRQ